MAIWLVLVMSMSLVAGGMQAPTLGPGEALAFDYYDADLTNYAVTRFEASWDGGGAQALSPTSFRDSGTLAGATSYQVIQPFSTGSHTVSFRACNAGGCGAASSPFAFAVGGSSGPPTTPSNIRIVPRR